MKNNYVKILSLVITFVLVAMGLLGCQLAKENSQYSESKFCGVFVTYKLDGEKQEDVETDNDKKYYADFEQGTIKQDDVNKKETTSEYKFGDLNGYAFFSYEDGEGDDKTLRVMSDNVFEDEGTIVKISSNMDGNGADSDITTYNADPISKSSIVSLSSKSSDKKVTSQEYELNATIYVTSKFKGSIAFNPIIKEDKKFYTTLNGEYNYIDAENGLGCSIAKSNKSTITDGNNEKITQITTYNVNVKVVDNLKGIKIKEIDDNDTVTKTQEIAKDDYEFKIGKNTAYIIIEEKCEDKDGNNFIKRTILNRNDIKNGETIYICNYANGDGIITPERLYIEK